MAKPYNAKVIHSYLQKVKLSHPDLYSRINNYLKRYMKPVARTHLQASYNHSFDNGLPIDGTRGQDIGSQYDVSLSGFAKVSDYFLVNFGGSYHQGGDFSAHNTYISMGYEYLQLDIGYKEHWLAPHHDGALLLTTQAKPGLSATISNPMPFENWWNARYQMSFGILEEMDEIKFSDPAESGEPYLLTMHFSVQPFDWWTLSANRTFMMGGGARDIDLGDIWDAITDPVNSDNCGSGDTECQSKEEEIGNQQASIASKFDLNVYNMPFSIFWEFGAEDTKVHKNSRYGNLARNYGLFFPYLTDDISLNIEHANFSSAWYSHHIYGDGYANDGARMGHWWGDRKNINDGSPGDSESVKLTYQYDSESVIGFMFKSAKIDSKSNASVYQRSQEYELSYEHTLATGFLGLTLNYANTTYGDSVFRSSIHYRW